MSDNFLKQLNDDLAAVVQRVRRSLVQVSNGRSGHGAGSIWHTDGLLVTNNHVIGRRPPTVTLADGRSFTANVLARDEEHDLAALAIDATDLPTIELGDSKALKPGQWVTSIGHPWGVLGAITSGMIIGQTGNEWPELRQISDEHEWVVASLHMLPGHSGGPMVDDQGRLVGINTMINGPDVGVAIPYYPGSVAHSFYQRALDLMRQGSLRPDSTERQHVPTYV
jgi:S1-C subfamily serine protease